METSRYRSWRVLDIEGFDMNTKEDSKDGVMKFFQTREKKKRKNSVFGTYTLMISTVIKIFFILEGHKTFVWMFMFSSWKKAIEKFSLSINKVGPTKV